MVHIVLVYIYCPCSGQNVYFIKLYIISSSRDVVPDYGAILPESFQVDLISAYAFKWTGSECISTSYYSISTTEHWIWIFISASISPNCICLGFIFIHFIFYFVLHSHVYFHCIAETMDSGLFLFLLAVAILISKAILTATLRLLGEAPEGLLQLSSKGEEPISRRVPI
jgi:hypothetical protein